MEIRVARGAFFNESCTEIYHTVDIILREIAVSRPSNPPLARVFLSSCNWYTIVCYCAKQ